MKEKPRVSSYVMGEDKERRICGKKRVINKTEVVKADVQVDESAGRLRGKKKKGQMEHGKRKGSGGKKTECLSMLPRCLSHINTHIHTRGFNTAPSITAEAVSLYDWCAL